MNYPKPSAMGGTLIRTVIQSFKQNLFKLPLPEPILIACSGGVDSMVLAHLVARYGRKIISPELITLLHFDHGWRKESATIEREGVKQLALRLGVNFKAVDLSRPKPHEKGNAEDRGRSLRNEVYEKLAGPRKSFRFVFTAHHQDDVIETLIWRFFRGEFLLQGQGILYLDDPVLRPLLQVSKEQIRAYADQEKVPFFEDPTNQDPQQMRAQLRGGIIPSLEKLFPGLKKSVAGYAQKNKKGVRQK